MCFSRKMSERVNTLTNKVKKSLLSFAVEEFEIKDPLKEKLVCGYQLFS